MTLFRMHATAQIFPTASLVGAFCSAHGAKAQQQHPGTGTERTGAAVPAPVDAAIQKALQQISAADVQATITKLVSFNNGNTLSSMEKNLPAGQVIPPSPSRQPGPNLDQKKLPGSAVK